jgi:endonuclease YncB( thermonuclease family)
LTVTSVALGAAALLAPPRASEAAEARSKVILDGKPVAVHFNDGDSFRVIGGTANGTKARLMGFNTLESYGPVHSWGGWTEKEMYVLAKMATLNARRGVWECFSQGDVDTYGRSLIWCPGLAEDQIRKGLAHVMTVTDDPGDPMLVAAQEDAIANRRGIWAHGVPEFVLTSLHSVDESVGRKDRARNYNRLVSSADGHSVKWKHQDAYNECDKVCHKTYRVDEAKVDAVAKALQGDKRFAKALAGLSPDVVRGVVRDFARLRHINRDVPEDERDALAAHLRDLANRGELGSDTAGEPASCMVHVPFKRRYGGGKAECLK